MSQSDYIEYKKIYTELKNGEQTTEENKYIMYKEYGIKNVVINTKNTFNLLQPPNKMIIDDMEKTLHTVVVNGNTIVTTDCLSGNVCY